MNLENPKLARARRFAAFEPSDFGLKVGRVVPNAPRPTWRFERGVRLVLRGKKRLVEDNRPYLVLRPASLSAFTLIEVLLAMAISAIVLVAINAVFATAVRLREKTTSAVDAALPVERTLDLLRRDLKGTVGPRGFLAGDFKCGVQAMGATMGLSGEAGGAGLDFFTSTGRMGDNTPWGDLQEVLYELKAPADRDQAGMDLVRCVNRNLLATTTPTPDIQPLLSHVETMQFDCYDGTQWRNTWDTSSGAGDTNLPTAVRIRIHLVAQAGEDASKKAPLEMLVPLMAVTRATK